MKDLWPLLPWGHRTSRLGPSRLSAWKRKLFAMGQWTGFFVAAALLGQGLSAALSRPLRALAVAAGQTGDEPPSATVRGSGLPAHDLAVAARIAIDAPLMAEAAVQYGPNENYGARTPWLTLGDDGRLVTTIIGVHPNSTIHFGILARDASGRLFSSSDRTVDTPHLPVEIPRGLSASSRGPHGCERLLVDFRYRGQSLGAALMVDRNGRVLWYRVRQDSPAAFDRLRNGHFIVYSSQPGRFDEVALDGTVVGSWPSPRSPLRVYGLEFRETPDGNAFMIGGYPESPHTRRRGEAAQAVDEAVVELTHAGAVARTWSTSPPTGNAGRGPDTAESRDPADGIRSIAPTPDGNLLVALGNAGLVKLDARTGHVLWRLGGPGADLRTVGDGGERVSATDAMVLADGDVLVFDDGSMHTPPESRAVEYRIDESERTATLVWQHRPDPPRFARSGGSARRLSNGHTLVGFGSSGTILEVDGESRVVWELDLPGAIHRAVPVSGLYEGDEAPDDRCD